MQIDLAERTAVVTGSTAGIGFAIAKGLAESGATVVVNGRTQAAVHRAVTALKSAVPGAVIRGVAADLGTASGCLLLFRVEPRIPDGEWTRFFEVNVMSGVRLSRAYLPGMLERNWGRVVFLPSESALNIPADMIHYGFTKTANLAISRGLAKRLAGTGVTVNAVRPGPTLSEGVEAMLKESAEKDGQTIEEAAIAFVKANRSSSIIQRPATPDEVAHMVVYACSPQASATTGAALRVDGGVVETIA